MDQLTIYTGDVMEWWPPWIAAVALYLQSEVSPTVSSDTKYVEATFKYTNGHLDINPPISLATHTYNVLTFQLIGLADIYVLVAFLW